MSYKDELKRQQAARRQAAKDRQKDDYRLDPGYQAIYNQERGE